MGKIIVTDLTRFHNQGLVCLAGIDPATGQCIRPFKGEPGERGNYLHFDSVKKHSVVPGSILKGEFVPKADASRPHSEDHLVPKLRVKGSATSDEFQEVLEMSSAATFRAGFGKAPVDKFFPVAAPPAHSIFTLKLRSPAKQFSLIADEQYGPTVFKAHVEDAQGVRLSYLKVTDLGFSDHIKRIEAEDPYLRKINAFFAAQEVLYLRIGLGREYAPQGDEARRGFWLQINGIYSFPNFREDLRMYD